MFVSLHPLLTGAPCPRTLQVGTSAAAPLPMGVRPREPSRNGGDPDSPISALVSEGQEGRDASRSKLTEAA